jgi:RND family efflux transporter MFP subunit
MTQQTISTSLPSRFAALRFGFLPQSLQPFSPLLLVLALAGGAFLVLGRGGAKPVEDKGDGLRRVQFQTVRSAPINVPRTLVGTLRARVETDMGFRVAGKIAERKVQAGDPVKAGTVLAVLDATDFRLARESAEAELAAARSSTRQQELDFARVSELRTRGYSTAQAEEKARAALDEARGRLERAKRQVDMATNSQAYAELKADADGIVTAVQAEAGQVVAAGQAIVRIARDGEREAQVAVPEQDIDFVRKARASMTLWSDNARSFSATLRELSPNADPGTRTFLARYSVQGLAAGAPLGQTINLQLAGNDVKNGIRVPLSAVLNEGGGAEIFVLAGQDNLLTRKKVTILSYDGRDALIGAGLDDGDRVVTLGVHTLRTGEKVVPLPETMRKG